MLILFVWFTDGCGWSEIEAINRALPYAAVLGAVLGLIGGAVGKARGARIRPFLHAGLAAFVVGFWLFFAHHLLDTILHARGKRKPPHIDKTPEPPPAKKEDRR